jgi:hypothetical protein
MANHIHTWRRFPTLNQQRKNTFFCNHPNCFKKLTLSNLDKKFAGCANCGMKFIVDASIVLSTDECLTCPTCNGRDIPSVDTQVIEAMKLETSQFLDEGFQEVKREIVNERLALEKDKARIDKALNKLLDQKEKLISLLKSHRETFKRDRDALREEKRLFREKAKELKEKEETEAFDNSVLTDAILNILKEKQDESPGFSD